MVLLSPFAAGVVWGSAFSIAEQGAKAAGMATAYTSIADDGSAIYFNPAGIAFQAGTHLQMDAIAVVGLFRFFPSATQPGVTVPSNGYSESVKPHFIPVASMSATKQLSDRLTIGFGVYVPFGLAATRRAIEAVAVAAGCPGPAVLRRTREGHPFVTDGGHHMLDASLGRIADPKALAAGLVRIPGVVEHGLFIGLVKAAIIAGAEGVRIVEVDGS